jgi:WD40 repeat protein
LPKPATSFWHETTGKAVVSEVSAVSSVSPVSAAFISPYLDAAPATGYPESAGFTVRFRREIGMSSYRTRLCLAICLLSTSSTAHGDPPADRQQSPAARTARLDLYDDPLPEGAVARLGTVRFRCPGNDAEFAGEVLAPLSPFALSPDGKILATGERHAIRFWEMATGKELRAVHLPTVAWLVRAILFSPDGKLAAVHVDNADPISGPPFSEHSIHVVEVAGGKVLSSCDGKREAGYREVAFSSDSHLLAAFQDAEHERPQKGTLVLWDARTGKEQRQLKDVFSAAFTPDGKQLIAGNKDGVIQILDPGTGREVGRLEGHRAPVDVLAVSPDGRSLVSADEEGSEPREGKRTETSVRLWDQQTGKLRQQWPGGEKGVISLQFSPDGKTVAVQDGKGNLLLYEATSGKERQRLVMGPSWQGSGYAFSPDGKVLLLQDGKGPFAEWDLARNTERRRWGGASASFPVVYSPDGKVAVSSGPVGVIVWDVATGKEWNTVAGHRHPLDALSFSPDGRLVASLDREGIFGIWEAQTGKPLLPMAADKPEMALRFRFSTDGTLLSAVTKYATVSVWDLTGGLKVRRFPIGTEATISELGRMGWAGEPDGLPITLVYRPDGKGLAVLGEGNVIHLWDLVAGKELRALRGHQERIGVLRFSDDGKLLASASEDRTIRLWDVETGKELQQFRGGEREIADFQFSPDSKVLAWRWSEELHLWDVVARKELRQFAATVGGERSLAFHRDGKALAAVVGRQAVHVWDVTTGKELRTLGSTEFDFRTAELFRSSAGAVLASVAMDSEPPGALKRTLFDVATGYRFPFLLYWRDGTWSSPDGKTLVHGSSTLEFTEMITGETIGQLPEGHRKGVVAAAFSADGKLLATGGSDGTILVWDWRRACGVVPDGGAKIGARELERAWDDLGRKEGKSASRAIGTLAAAGDEAVDWLGKRLEPVGEKQREAIRAWIAALDDNRFEERARANKELEQLGADAEPLLRQALTGKLSPEARRRVEILLADVGRWPLPMLQKVRAVQALEQIGTPKAREVLQKLASGIPDARLTQEAADALARLSRR